MNINFLYLAPADYRGFGSCDPRQPVHQFLDLHLLNDTDQRVDDDDTHEGDVLKLAGYQNQDS